ncbi:hypothetical protein NUACC21_65320 [Scytonema sp. NUACC21]
MGVLKKWMYKRAIANYSLSGLDLMAQVHDHKETPTVARWIVLSQIPKACFAVRSFCRVVVDGGGKP